jgi:NADH-quinone oxidoreductase subunit C
MTPSLDDLQQGFMRLLSPVTGVASGGPGAGESAAGTGLPAVVSAVELPVAGCRTVEARAKGYHLDATVAPGQVVAAARLMDEAGFAMDTITGVDWMAAGEMEVVYDYYHPLSPLHVVVRARVPRDRPELPTISAVFPGADWHERETHDFFGIRFTGNPNLTPFLLPEDADYHPLRKDFAGAS